MTEEPDTMTVKETCARLDISRDTLYRRMKDKVLVPLPRNQMQARTPLHFRRADVERLAQPRTEG